MDTLTSISIFFPCYNEELNIKPTIEAATKTISKIAKRYELIIINDGSTDGTEKIAKDIAKNDVHIRVVSHPYNLGYGAALKTGIKESKYDWVFFTDGDLQFDLSELSLFIPYTTKYNVIIGYRKDRAEGQSRARNAKLFKVFIDILFRLHVKDIDCAFKLFKRSTLQSLTIESSGAFTSSEILYKLKKKKEVFMQIPVTHYPRKWGTPTGNNFRVIIKAAYEALKLYVKIKLHSFAK